LANMTWFSFLSPRNALCPFCNETLYTQHFFDCDQYRALGDERVSWNDFVEMLVRREWMDSIASSFRRLLGWSRRAEIFRDGFRHRVDEYFEELEWSHRDRIRRAGGTGPPSIQWSILSWSSIFSWVWCHVFDFCVLDLLIYVICFFMNWTQWILA
jgi:hypothetical protein